MSFRWSEVTEHYLPTALRTGLGAEPVYSTQDSSWYVRQPNRILRYGFGDAAAFQKAENDLDLQMGTFIRAGDLAHTNGDDSTALTSYRLAGDVGATQVGPEIDAAGAPAATQPHTQAAWLINAKLANEGIYTAAKADVDQMMVHYREAIADGRDALKPPGPGPSPGPAPGPGPSPGPSPGPAPGPAPTPVVVAAAPAATDYTVPILVGAGVIAAGLVYWGMQGQRRTAHA